MKKDKDLDLIIKAIKEDPENLANCLEENKTINLKFLLEIGEDPHFQSVSLGCKAARLITLNFVTTDEIFKK